MINHELRKKEIMMRHQWFDSVLVDMKRYALKHGCFETSKQIEILRHISGKELEIHQEKNLPDPTPTSQDHNISQFPWRS